jgi:hypothetical protein
MPIAAFQRILEEAFPRQTWVPLVRGLREGVWRADALITSTPMLRSLVGGDLRGQMRRIGILDHLHELCAGGRLPFQAEMTKMPFGAWHWLDIRAEQFRAQIVRTEGAGALPSDTRNRQPECFKNRYDLLTDGRIPEITDLLGDEQERYAVIGFGADRGGRLVHAILGMPSSDDTEWLAHVNLLREAGAGASDSDVPPPAPTPPDPTTTLKLLGRIEEMLDRDKKKPGDKSA